MDFRTGPTQRRQEAKTQPNGRGLAWRRNLFNFSLLRLCAFALTRPKSRPDELFLEAIEARFEIRGLRVGENGFGARAGVGLQRCPVNQIAGAFDDVGSSRRRDECQHRLVVREIDRPEFELRNAGHGFESIEPHFEIGGFRVDEINFGTCADVRLEWNPIHEIGGGFNHVVSSGRSDEPQQSLVVRVTDGPEGKLRVARDADGNVIDEPAGMISSPERKEAVIKSKRPP